MSLFEHFSGARFSECRKYRYTLWRHWDDTKPPALFVMLNPSTADDVDNDATVERCQRRALAMQFGGLRVANIFAYRSTDPDALYGLADPVGPENDVAIVEATQGAGIIVCGWGAHGKLHGRGEAVLALLRRAGATPHYLILNADDTPRHPLYVAYSVAPVPFDN